MLHPAHLLEYFVAGTGYVTECIKRDSGQDISDKLRKYLVKHLYRGYSNIVKIAGGSIHPEEAH